MSDKTKFKVLSAGATLNIGSFSLKPLSNYKLLKDEASSLMLKSDFNGIIVFDFDNKKQVSLKLKSYSKHSY